MNYDHIWSHRFQYASLVLFFGLIFFIAFAMVPEMQCGEPEARVIVL